MHPVTVRGDATERYAAPLAQDATFLRLLAVGIQSPPPSCGCGRFAGLVADDAPPDLDCAGGGSGGGSEERRGAAGEGGRFGLAVTSGENARPADLSKAARADESRGERAPGVLGRELAAVVEPSVKAGGEQAEGDVAVARGRDDSREARLAAGALAARGADGRASRAGRGSGRSSGNAGAGALLLDAAAAGLTFSRRWLGLGRAKKSTRTGAISVLATFSRGGAT